MKFILSYLLLSTIALSSPTPECQNVRLADIGWTDVSATTAVAAQLLKSLGYTPSITLVSLPVALASLENNHFDAFLGNWMPSQESDIKPYLQKNSITQLSKNLEHARYTLAVPDYVYNAGIRSFEDLKRHESQFKKQIYGIEAGNDGNHQILKMISDNAFGLGTWNIVESSEQGMLIGVKQAIARKDWVVFLGWAPHPMNLTIPMHYLSGGDSYFGINSGDASVYTLTRKGLKKECAEVAGFLERLKFTVDQENELMALILDQKLSPEKAAQVWLGKNTKTATQWTQNSDLFAKYLFGINNFSESTQIHAIPIGAWAERSVNYLTHNFSKQFLNFSSSFESLIQILIRGLLGIPALVLILFLSALIYAWRHSILLGFGVCVGLLVILNLGLWVETIQTLVLVLLAAFISLLIGVPMGVLAARNKLVYQILRPLLDLMQTVPTFVYLIPTLMLFGLGMVPGLISTLIFAISAPIRMTYLGLTQVPKELLKVGDAFGASKLQRFWKIELPGAWPSILAGFSQCIMLSLSMVVIAALVGADGLGTSVVRALNTVNLKQGFESGLAIVILAIILDRSLQSNRRIP
ncbi:MAG: glycine betaine ABC transporter substrate-binding protein [Myxococcaceae bacterium]